MLPAATTIVEVLESVEVDEELLDACRRVKSRGCTLALDDCILESRFGPLLSLIDILKVEFPALSETQQHRVIESARQHGFRLLAEKVETHEHYEFARQLGYDYFQGYFFCRPQMVSTRRLPQSGIQCLRLLRQICQPDFDVDQIGKLIRGDLSLSYKLLRNLNPPMEYGAWSTINELAASLGIEEANVYRLHNESIEWAARMQPAASATT